jgi:hypothetical protein
MPTKREDGVECCYARQTKFWITDPDGALWEIYVFHEDIGEHGAAVRPLAEHVQAQALASAAALPAVWEHHLRDAAVDAVPHQDNSLHEVRLVGAINRKPGISRLADLISDSLRALRPGAAIHIHGLAGDRACNAPLALPGPAAAVQHVPAVSEVAAALADAGFVEITIDQLSHTVHFVVDGVPMRELQMSARKPGHRPRGLTHQAVYLGPLREVVDDFGTLFLRGVPTPLNVHDWQMLATSAAGRSFLFLGPETPTEGCCGAQPAGAAVATASR